MRCPRCGDVALRDVITDRGVVVERCPECGGIWFDRGELIYFSDFPRRMQSLFGSRVSDEDTGSLGCPRCEVPLKRIALGEDLTFHRCPECRGTWVDQTRLKRLADAPELGLDVHPDRFPDASKTPTSGPTDPDGVTDGSVPTLTSLPSLTLRSGGVLLALYGILTLALIGLVEWGYFSAGLAVLLGVILAAGQFVVSPYVMDLILRFLYDFSWRNTDELPEHLREFLDSVCDEQGMRVPSVGLIHDGAPNAFTYGHTPWNMRLVVTEGILDLLEPDEVEAVVAHELGHGKHWDMAVMTAAQVVPLILYYLYRMAARVRAKKQAATVKMAVMVGAYVLYLVSEYLILWLSRCREYHADRFSGRVTGDPAALASALMKIAYGLANRGRDASSDESKEDPERLDAVGALGIFDSGAAKSLAISSTGAPAAAEDSDAPTQPDRLKDVMQWDLWNPWATYHELHSTHPLVAHRLQHLGDQARAMGQSPFVTFDRRPSESYWDEFVIDLAFVLLPVWFPLFLAGGAWLSSGFSLAGYTLAGLGLFALGLGMLFRTLFAYGSDGFPEMSVAGLLKKIKVSRVRPVPVTLEGTIIGRGVPGLVWSEDFVLRDETGLIFLDYRQPLALLEFLFGLLRAGDYAERTVTVRGWYRRAPVPYVELYELETGDGRTHRCYVYPIKLVLSVLVGISGIVLLFFP